MKKLLSWLLCLTMILSSAGMTVMAEDTWAPTASSYTADFTNADELSKWKKVTGAAALSIADGVLTWPSAGNTQYLLPTAQMENFVINVDLTHTAGNNYFGILFGVDETFSNVGKYKLRFKAKNTRVGYYNNSTSERDSGNTSGYQWDIVPYQMDNTNSDLNQSNNLKVIVYNKQMTAWMNDQLIFSADVADAYAGGYIGVEGNYYKSIIRSISVREATSADLALAESFNYVDADTADETIGNLTSFTRSTAGSEKNGKLIANNWGWAEWTKPGGRSVYIDKNKKSIGDHVYSTTFLLDSARGFDAAASYIVPMFGVKDTETGIEGYFVYVKWDGSVDIDKFAYNNGALSAVYKNSEGDYMSIAGDKVRAMFPDKLETFTKSDVDYEVLKRDVAWEYKHVLHDGTIDVYLNDVLVLSRTSKDFEDLEGYAGIMGNGLSVDLYSVGVRGVDADFDLNRPNTVKARLANGDGTYEAAANSIVRFYTLTTTEDATIENYYGTAYADENGLFDIQLGHNQTYRVKLFKNGSAVTPLAVEDNVKYTAGNQLVIDFEKSIESMVLVDAGFANNAGTDASANTYPITFAGDAKTETSKAFGEALVLDGVGDYAKVGDINAFALEDADKLTVEAVFMPRERDGIKTMTVVGGAPMVKAGTPAGYGLYVDQDANGNDIIAFRTRVYDSASQGFLTKEASAPCVLNKAYYAAGVYDGSSLKLYVNGKLEDTVSATGDIYVVKDVKNTYPLIGAEAYYLNNQVKHFFKGEIAKAKVTNGIIDADTVLAAYENYILTDGYALEGEEFVDDVTAKVSFSSTTPAKGDTVTVTAAVRNVTDADKTVTVKLVPGYFAALTSESDTAEITVPANGAKTAEFTYKLLEGGREPFKAYVYENGEEVAYAVNSLSVTGAGYYKGDIHNHSTRSDGVNTFEENIVEGFATKNLSYSYSTEHNQYNYYSVNKANATNALYNPLQFMVMPGSEFTTKVGHVNAYALDNDVSTSELSKVNKPFWDENTAAALEAVTDAEGKPSVEKWQAFIDLVEGTGEGEYGGLLYLNHTADPTYYIEDSVIEQLSGFTGYEVWNGAASAFADMTVRQRNTWDKINSQGWGHVVGQASTDSHGSVMFGTIQRVSYMNEISADEINRTMKDGNSIGTNGPEIRFDINGAPMNGTAVVTDGKATFNIDVYDPMGDIEEVKLVKNIVSGQFTTDNRTEEVLYAKGSNAAIGTWSYSTERDVAANEFYRVEVTTAKNPYGSMDSKGITMTDEGAGKGWAFTNNIWIATEGTSNSTNISEISYNGANVSVAELPTGIKYLKGTGNMVLSNLNVIADGTVQKTAENGIVTISVTAADGTVKTTELYLVGDITVIEALTNIVFDDVYYDAEMAEASITVNDEEGLLNSGDAVLVFAVYNNGKLIGLDTETVTAEEFSEICPCAKYPEQSDTSSIVMKAMLFRTLSDLIPLCDEAIN